jgi:hypothetical protein
VADPRAEADPWVDAAIDWDATIQYRLGLYDLGLGVAEAMDTARRGMGLDWAASQELIRRSLSAAKDIPGARIACGAGTDHLEPSPDLSLDDVIRAYENRLNSSKDRAGALSSWPAAPWPPAPNLPMIMPKYMAVF